MGVGTVGWLIFGILVIAYLGICCALPSWFVFRTGRFWTGLLIGCGCTVGMALCSQMLTMALQGRVPREVSDAFLGFGMGLLFVGWEPVIIPLGIALLIHRQCRERIASVTCRTDGPPLSKVPPRIRGRVEPIVIRVAISAGWCCIVLSIIVFFLYGWLVPPESRLSRIHCLDWDVWLTGVASVFAVVGIFTNRKW
jgi:MFS family permease